MLFWTTKHRWPCVATYAAQMIQCSCGRDDCETRLYVQHDGVTLHFSPKITGAALGEVTFHPDDEQLKQLIRDAVSVLRERADKRLRSEVGLQEVF